jgi:uncharacterized membrane protein (UPF0127 family)
MSRNAIFAAIAAIVFAAGLYMAMPRTEAEPDAPVENLVIQTQSGTKHSFSVEIADTPEKAEKGLMFRTRMSADHGMLFEFGKPQRVSFWMKDTLIPLDMLFVDANGRIASIEANAAPQSLSPHSSRAPVIGVVEIKGGLAEKMGIKPGDTVVHPFFKSQ